MTDGPDGNDRLAPYSPSETPSLPTTGRRWAAIVLLLVFALGFLLYVLEWVFSFL